MITTITQTIRTTLNIITPKSFQLSLIFISKSFEGRWNHDSARSLFSAALENEFPFSTRS